MGFPSLFFFIFVFSIQLTVKGQYNFLPMTGSNRGPLESKATTLPTEPLPLPYNTFYPFQNKHQIQQHLQSVKMLCAFQKTKYSESHEMG